MSMLTSVGKLTLKASEVTGGIGHTYDMHAQPGALSAFTHSLDDLSAAATTKARPGQPIGIFASADQGYHLLPLEARTGKATQTAGPPQLGGLTMQFGEFIPAEGSKLVGVTSLTQRGVPGAMYTAGARWF